MAGIKFIEKNKYRAWNALKRDMDKLKSIHALGSYEWRSAPWTLSGVCELHPPQWVIDRIVHKIKPVEKKKTIKPITGEDFKSWRKLHELTQKEAAEFLDMSLSSIKRSERNKTSSIVASLKKNLEGVGNVKEELQNIEELTETKKEWDENIRLCSLEKDDPESKIPDLSSGEIVVF